MKKFVVVCLTVVLMLTTNLFFAAAQTESVFSGEQWRAYEGTTLNVLGMNISYIAGLEPLLPEFEKLTGIKVNLDQYSEELAHQRVRTELASGSGAYDIVWVQANWSIPYAESGWLYPLQKLIDNSDITFPKVLDMDDIMPSLLNLMRYKEELYGLPFFAATIIMYYRTDLLQEAGIDPAELDTIDGFVAAVKKLHSSEIAGVALRGHPGESSWHWTVFLKGLGGKYVKDIKGGDYYPTLDSKEAIEAAAIYGDLLGNYSIPAAATAKYDQVVIAMQQGNTATVIEGAPLAGRILDPEKSKVIGKVGFKLVPQGPGGRHPAFTGHGFSLASASKNKEAAWLFLQWSNSREVTKKIALSSNHIAVHRDSIWNDPEFREKWNLPGEGDFLKMFQESLRIADPDYRPRIQGWAEVNKSLGDGLNRIMLGQETAEESFKKVQSQAIEILKRLKYIQ